MSTPRHLRDDRGSMLLAMLFAIVITALVAAAVILAIAGQKKTQQSQTFLATRQSADTAVADALTYLNRGGDPDCYTASSPRTNTVAGQPSDGRGVNWSWYATATTSAAASTCDDGRAATSYSLTVTSGPASAPTKNQSVVNISSLRVPKANGAQVNGGRITYTTGDGANMTGFFADSYLALRGTSAVTSYNSAAGAGTTGRGMVGTNGTMSFTTGTSIDKAVLWDFKARPSPDRCVGTPCTGGVVQTQQIRLGVSGECAYDSPHPASTCAAPTRFIDEACNTATDLKPWIASEQGSTPTLMGGTTYCVSALVFDRNTTINASPTNPAKVYVTSGANSTRYGAENSGGAVTVSAGVSVNVTGAAPASTSLLVYAKASTVTLDAGGAGDTNVAWNLFAPNATCTGADDPTGTRTVNIYGSMTCSTLTTGSKWRLRYDEQQQLIAPSKVTAQVWYVTALLPK